MEMTINWLQPAVPLKHRPAQNPTVPNSLEENYAMHYTTGP